MESRVPLIQSNFSIKVETVIQCVGIGHNIIEAEKKAIEYVRSLYPIADLRVLYFSAPKGVNEDV